MIKVFVYGTLKPGKYNYALYCEGKVIEATKAYGKGQLFDLSLGYPGMTIGEGKVQGFLLSFKDETVLEHLDQLESYSPQRPDEENEYYRQEIMVYGDSGESLGVAWAYLMTSEKVKQFQGVFLPSGDWQEIINN